MNYQFLSLYELDSILNQIVIVVGNGQMFVVINSGSKNMIFGEYNWNYNKYCFNLMFNIYCYWIRIEWLELWPGSYRILTIFSFLQFSMCWLKLRTFKWITDGGFYCRAFTTHTMNKVQFSKLFFQVIDIRKPWNLEKIIKWKMDRFMQERYIITKIYSCKVLVSW